MVGSVQSTSAAVAVSPPQKSSTGQQQDYYSSEEEYQVQLALALSVSNSDSPPHSDQIRAAKLLSLGKYSTTNNNHHHHNRPDDAPAAHKLSAQYWVSSLIHIINLALIIAYLTNLMNFSNLEPFCLLFILVLPISSDMIVSRVVKNIMCAYLLLWDMNHYLWTLRW